MQAAYEKKKYMHRSPPRPLIRRCHAPRPPFPPRHQDAAKHPGARVRLESYFFFPGWRIMSTESQSMPGLALFFLKQKRGLSRACVGVERDMEHETWRERSGEREGHVLCIACVCVCVCVHM